MVNAGSGRSEIWKWLFFLSLFAAVSGAFAWRRDRGAISKLKDSLGATVTRVEEVDALRRQAAAKMQEAQGLRRTAEARARAASRNADALKKQLAEREDELHRARRELRAARKAKTGKVIGQGSEAERAAPPTKEEVIAGLRDRYNQAVDAIKAEEEKRYGASVAAARKKWQQTRAKTLAAAAGLKKVLEQKQAEVAKARQGIEDDEKELHGNKDKLRNLRIRRAATGSGGSVEALENLCDSMAEGIAEDKEKLRRLQREYDQKRQQQTSLLSQARQCARMERSELAWLAKARDRSAEERRGRLLQNPELAFARRHEQLEQAIGAKKDLVALLQGHGRAEESGAEREKLLKLEKEWQALVDGYFGEPGGAARVALGDTPAGTGNGAATAEPRAAEPVPVPLAHTVRADVLEGAEQNLRTSLVQHGNILWTSRGSGNESGSPFQAESPWVIGYERTQKTSEDGDLGALFVNVMHPESDLPVATVYSGEGTKGVSWIYESGTFYVSVTSVNCHWVVGAAQPLPATTGSRTAE